MYRCFAALKSDARFISVSCRYYLMVLFPVGFSPAYRLFPRFNQLMLVRVFEAQEDS